MTEITHDYSTQIEGDLIAMLDEFHSLPEIWDDELDGYFYDLLRNSPKSFPKYPYFSPSSSTSCPRELYVKANRAKKDMFRRQPHQRRWAKIGNLIGEMIQLDFLYIDKHYENHTGNKPKFVFERNADGTPRFEKYAGVNNVKVTHKGETFYLYGFPDLITTYTTDGGEKLRVGIEVKSKQTTSARTSHYSLKEAESGHFAQTVCYDDMFGCDYYVVLYVNAAKKGWFVTDEDYAKSPDIRAFCQRIVDVNKTRVFDHFAEVTKAVRSKTPPPLDLDNWTFNNFKTACALDLSDEEYAELIALNHRMQNSNMKDAKKRDYAAALEFITDIRKGTK